MEQDLIILCPFCNAPYSAEMNHEFDSSGDCDTCDYYDDCTLEITCTNCKRVVYKK